MHKIFIIFIIIPAVVGAEWTPIGPRGEIITSIVINPYFGYVNAASWGSGLFWSEDGGSSWVQVNDSLGRLNITNLTYVLPPTGKNCPLMDVYAGTDSSGIFVWSGIDTSCAFWYEKNDSLTDLYIAALTSDPIWGVVYAGTGDGKIFKTFWDSHFWVDATSTLPQSGAVTLRAASPDTVYALLVTPVIGCGLWKTTNGGEDWQQLLEVGVFSIAIDPTDHDMIYAACEFGKFGRSDNGGNTWTFYYSIPIFAGCLLVDSHHTIYAAGAPREGVYKSTDYGESWNEMNEGLDDSTACCLLISGDTLYAGTNDGVWRYLIDVGVVETENDAMVFQCYPNPTRGSCIIICDRPASITVCDVAGRTIETLDYDPGKTLKISFEVENTPGGIYFIRAKAVDGSVTERIAVLR